MFIWMTDVITSLGYAGVAVLMFLENVFPPIPSELVVPLAGFVAATGRLRLDVVIAAGSVGSLAGAVLWYDVGRRVGERRLRSWVEAYGKWLTVSPRDLDRAAAWFERHGPVAVLVGRLVPGVRTFVSLPAGVARMPFGTFLLYSTLGTAAWTTLLAVAGLLLEANFTRVGRYVDVATNVLLVALAVLMVVRYARCWLAQTDGRRTDSPAGRC